MKNSEKIMPLIYRIEIEPDMTRHRFEGKAEITLQAAEKTEQVKLNLLDLSIGHCRYRRGEKDIECRFCIDPGDETITVELPEPVEGDFKLAIDYSGEISASMAGFYRSRYTHNGKTYPIAVTQFQESDARRAFPCMDHPLHKAKFELAFIVGREWTVLANTPVKSETEMESGLKRVEFETTPVMSTYLVFFGVGSFRFLVDEADQRVRAAVLPGMEDLFRYGLDFARKSLHYCEAYYDIPFPLPKLDLIAVPDFAFGAMENWGAITFRENLLLYDPEITDVEGEERICEVIAHEMAHQWFGNLVTPSDWKYLWLNESFATYFGYGAVDHYHPDWRVWDMFVESHTEPSMSRDGLTDTTPIEIPGGSHVVINVSTAPIIYSKGGSILRQIEEFIGTDAFREGLRQYLKTHAYACADSPDLWEALQAASGRPVSHIMKRWVEQAGHPLVTADREGNRLVLHQKRFTFLPDEGNETVWPVPLVIRVWDGKGKERVIAQNFDDPSLTIDLGPDADAYLVNDRHAGFYRTDYRDTGNWGKICRMIREKALSPVDRWGMVHDRYALVKAGRLGIDTFLEDLTNFSGEDHPLPLMAILENLFHLFLISKSGKRERAAALEKEFLSGCLDRIGYHPQHDDSHAVLRLRQAALWHAAFFEIPGAVNAARDLFGNITRGEKIDPNIARAVLQAGAVSGDEKTLQWLEERLGASPSEHERLGILRALGCFHQPGLIKKVQQFILDSVPARNMFIPVAALAANPNAGDLMWDWFVAHAGDLEKIHPIIFERIIAAIVPLCALDRADEVDAFFTAYTKEKDLAAEAIRMSLERRDINRRLREADQ